MLSANNSAENCSKLTLVTSYYNPAGFKRHPARYQAFREQMDKLPIEVITVECAFEGKPFEVTSSANANHIQVRAAHPLWITENLLNIGLRKATTPYLMWCDMDLFFPIGWVDKVLEQLASHDICQAFTDVEFWGPDSEVIAKTRGFVADRMYGNPEQLYHSTGGAWAFSREFYNRMPGGLFDCTIAEGTDDIMAYALVGDVGFKLRSQHTPTVHRLAYAWEEAVCGCEIGVVDYPVIHKWHGSQINKQYKTRWKIMTDHGFDPDKHLFVNNDGVYQLSKKSPMLDEIMRYFKLRHEDSDTLQ